MQELIKNIINKLDLPQLTYADVRFTSTDTQTIFFDKGALKHFSSNLDSRALGIRVLKNGCWGFAGTTILSEQAIDKTIQRAITNAKLGSKFRPQAAKFTPLKPVVEKYHFQPQEDPFLMTDQAKIEYLEKIAKKLVGHEKIVYSHVFCQLYRQHKIYANTEGTLVESTVYDALPQMYVLASNGKEAMSRTYPGHMNGRRGGFEIIRGVEMEKHADEIIKQAIDLLDAPRIEEERADIIIGGGHLALQLHESVGHATEADRILGKEISYAGKTFIKPEMIGNFRYGSPQVNIYSDSKDERGMGFHLVDDEGTPAATVDIIKKGILMDQQNSQESAAILGLQPTSNMLATSGDDIPLIRMTNFCLAPGSGSLQELIANTENGYFVDFTKTWSIDDNRNNFQFSTEIGWKIENGELKHIVKEPTYFGITPEFWAACDAVCGEEEWEFHGTFHCGKGEPGQAMHLSHGVAPARFRNIVCNVKA